MPFPEAEQVSPDPTWVIAFGDYDPVDEGRREAIFALGNGMFVTRAASAHARADSTHYPGTYRAGCYNSAVSLVAGEEESNTSLVNLPNWLPLHFRINGGDWFCLESVEILDYRHTLDLRNAITHRELSFVDKGNRRTRICERRLVSMAQPHRAALRLQVTPLNWSGEVELRSEIDGRVINDNVARYGDYERRHLCVIDCGSPSPNCVWLHARTRESKVDLVWGIQTAVKGTAQSHCVREGDLIATGISAQVSEGETLAVEKRAALYTSRDPGVENPRGMVQQALSEDLSFADLRRPHEAAWRDLWQRASVEAEHEPTVLALRFHVFHILQTVSPHTSRLDAGVPARGWHGEGYRGHIFWDELFVFPFLNFRFPDLARALLMYRYRRLDHARAAARDAGLRGALYPWRSAPDGWEATPRHQKNLLSGHWLSDPTRLQRHIGSAVALNVWHYYVATADKQFLEDYGAEMVLEIARLWASIARYSPQLDRYEIKGVIGPDEYHNRYPGKEEAGLDNNAYTNVTAAWTLWRARTLLDQLSPSVRARLLRRLELSEAELDQWDHMSRRLRVVFHGEGIISQYEGFDRLREFDPQMLPDALADKRVDWALEAMGETADNYQVTKQADTLTLFYLFSLDEIQALFERLGYAFDEDCLLRTADYYLARTTHRSSLSRITYAGALAQVDPDRSWQLYRRALETDLHALKGESIAEGIHLGAMGGTLDVLQRRYLGLTPCLEGLRVEPAVPQALGRVRLGLTFRGCNLAVEASYAEVRIHSDLNNCEAVSVIHARGMDWLQPGAEVCIQATSGEATA